MQLQISDFRLQLPEGGGRGRAATLPRLQIADCRMAEGGEGESDPAQISDCRLQIGAEREGGRATLPWKPLEAFGVG